MNPQITNLVRWRRVTPRPFLHLDYFKGSRRSIMIKILELAVKAAENIAKSVVASTEVIATKTATSSLEESSKLDSKTVTQQVTHHKAVRKELDKLFD